MKMKINVFFPRLFCVSKMLYGNESKKKKIFTCKML